MSWTYLVTRWDGVVLGELPLATYTFNERMNAAGDWQATAALNPQGAGFSLVDAATLDPARTLIWAIDPGGTVRFGGPMWRAAASVTGDDAGTLTLSGTDFTGYLQRRILETRLNYSSSTKRPGDVVDLAIAQATTDGGWDMTDYSEDIDTTSGNLISIDLLVEEFHTLASVVQKMAQLSGFEWGWRYTGTQAGGDLGAQLVFKPTMGRATGLIFDTARNMILTSYVCDGAEIANEIWVAGSGTGSGKTTGTDADATVLSTYPLLQASVAHKTGDTASADLDDLAAAQVDSRKACARYATFEVYDDQAPLGTFVTGDTVRLIANDGFVQEDDTFRVTDISVGIDEDGKETFKASALSDNVATELVRRQTDIVEMMRHLRTAQKELENA